MKGHLKKLGQQINTSLTGSALKRRVDRWFDVYEDYIGVKEVRRTQQNVLKAEEEFSSSSKQRRLIQSQLMDLQENLKQIRQKLDSVKRSDEAYLELVTTEHKLIKDEVKLINELRSSEDMERECFGKFSQLLRAAHEIETLRQEKSKYLSLIGSIVGAVLGILATSINHAIKMRDFKALMRVVETKTSLEPSEENQSELVEILKENLAAKDADLKSLKQNSLNIRQNMEDANVKLEQLLTHTNDNLEYKLKVNTIVSVTATYALIAITLPLIIKYLD